MEYGRDRLGSRCGEGNSPPALTHQLHAHAKLQVSTVANQPRTAQDCAILWLGDRHPKFVHTVWAPAEIAQLQALVKSAPKGPVNWVDIAESLGVRYSFPLTKYSADLKWSRLTVRHWIACATVCKEKAIIGHQHQTRPC